MIAELVNLPALPYRNHQGKLFSTVLARPPNVTISRNKISSPAHRATYIHAFRASLTVLPTLREAGMRGWTSSLPLTSLRMALQYLHYWNHSTLLPKRGTRPVSTSAVASERTGLVLPFSCPHSQLSLLPQVEKGRVSLPLSCHFELSCA